VTQRIRHETDTPLTCAAVGSQPSPPRSAPASSATRLWPGSRGTWSISVAAPWSVFSCRRQKTGGTSSGSGSRPATVKPWRVATVVERGRRPCDHDRQRCAYDGRLGQQLLRSNGNGRSTSAYAKAVSRRTSGPADSARWTVPDRVTAEVSRMELEHRASADRYLELLAISELSRRRGR
jgi:hypothetical protein